MIARDSCKDMVTDRYATTRIEIIKPMAAQSGDVLEAVAVGFLQELHELCAEWVLAVIFTCANEANITPVHVPWLAAVTVNFRNSWPHPEMIYATRLEIIVATPIRSKAKVRAPKRVDANQVFTLGNAEKLVEMHAHCWNLRAVKQFKHFPVGNAQPARRAHPEEHVTEFHGAADRCEIDFVFLQHLHVVAEAFL